MIPEYNIVYDANTDLPMHLVLMHDFIIVVQINKCVFVA